MMVGTRRLVFLCLGQGDFIKNKNGILKHGRQNSFDQSEVKPEVRNNMTDIV